MILVTGASGKTGKAVIKALLAKGQLVRAWVHSRDQEESALASGAGEVVYGDLLDAATLNEACKGADSIYHICPNMHPQEYEIASVLIRFAKSAGVKHFVYHSVLHPQIQEMPHHWNKLRVEEFLFTCGMPFTILQPAAYMQNIFGYWGKITKEHIYPLPYAPQSRLTMVDLENVADVAAAVLTESHHQGAVYELCGPQNLDLYNVTRILSSVLKVEIKPATVSRQDWELQALSSGMSLYAIDTLLKMFQYYELYGFTGNSNVLAWLLNRLPTTFEQFLKREVPKLAAG